MAQNATFDLMTPAETAEAIGIKKNTLAVWRCTGRHGLPFVKVGTRVAYRRSDVQAWLDGNIRTQTA